MLSLTVYVFGWMEVFECDTARTCVLVRARCMDLCIVEVRMLPLLLIYYMIKIEHRSGLKLSGSLI